MKYNMIVCADWLIFALDFLWFAEDGENPLHVTLAMKLSENVIEQAK